MSYKIKILIQALLRVNREMLPCLLYGSNSNFKQCSAIVDRFSKSLIASCGMPVNKNTRIYLTYQNPFHSACT